MTMEKLKEIACHSLHCYGPDEVKSFAEKIAKLRPFLDPTVAKFLETEAPGKRILDIGCGTGDWCYQAAKYGAKSVDGFDKQEKMAELAKQATAQFNTVSIRLGDVKNMPYDDNSFDIALSMFVTCELPIEVISEHFKELHRVLVPGGKALVLNLSDPTYHRLFLTDGATELNVHKKIDQVLGSIPNYSSLQQASKAFEELYEITSACFAYDEIGSLFMVKDMKQLVKGQAVLNKTDITTFPSFFYDDKFLVDQTTAAGLHIDKVENVFTEERRVIHNTLNPATTYSKDVVNHPIWLLYHVSKPT